MRVRFTTVVPAVRTSEMDDLEVRSEMEVGAWVGVVHRDMPLSMMMILRSCVR